MSDSIIATCPAEVGAVDQAVAGTGQLGHKNIRRALIRLIGIQSREVGRSSATRHIGIAAAIDRDAVPQSRVSPAEVGAVDQAVAGTEELGHKSIQCPP